MLRVHKQVLVPLSFLVPTIVWIRSTLGIIPRFRDRSGSRVIHGRGGCRVERFEESPITYNGRGTNQDSPMRSHAPLSVWSKRTCHSHPSPMDWWLIENRRHKLECCARGCPQGVSEIIRCRENMQEVETSERRRGVQS